MFGKEHATLSPTRIDKVRQAKKSIDEHIGALAEEMRRGKSEKLQRFLAYVARFHHYSIGNLCLAIMQRPDITQLAGLRQWNKLGRKVKTGEKGIMILAPVTVRKKDLEPDEKDAADGGIAPNNGKSSQRKPDLPEEVTFFKPVYVFDIAQTEGEDVPSLIHAEGDVRKLWPALRFAVQHTAIPLEFVETIKACPSALGVSLGGRIMLRSDLKAADAFRTLAHEYAHELLHHRSSETSRQVRETEADAAAYVVCRHFGIECDSSDYLQLYDVKAELLLARLETIRQVASTIISRLDTELEAIRRPRGFH